MKLTAVFATFPAYCGVLDRLRAMGYTAAEIVQAGAAITVEARSIEDAELIRELFEEYR